MLGVHDRVERAGPRPPKTSAPLDVLMAANSTLAAALAWNGPRFLYMPMGPVYHIIDTERWCTSRVSVDGPLCSILWLTFKEPPPTERTATPQVRAIGSWPWLFRPGTTFNSGRNALTMEAMRRVGEPHGGNWEYFVYLDDDTSICLHASWRPPSCSSACRAAWWPA